MKKYFKKKPPKKIKPEKEIKTDKKPTRQWGLATRLEHRRIKGKDSQK